ncbi:MAG: trypsin-like peptidase domain-containing protein [Nanoarchaeota archaeon]|jgi:S1-C subfamily serine protease|nr:trypsin-like peptidase domain-containing protein [Nanoarchaeota archaeon]
MRRRHKVAIGAFTTLTIIFMVLTVIVMNSLIIKQNVENRNLQEEIRELQEQTDGKINEVAADLINTKNSISDKFNILDKDLSSTNKKIGELSVTTNKDFSSIIEQSIPAITTVRTLSMQGSGFFISIDGYLITNTHVLLNDIQEFSNLIQVVTSDNQIYSAEVIGAIKDLDLTLLKIEATYPYLELANSDELEKGENVIAIGNPEGLQLSVTDGIISATKRIGLNNQPYYIQTNTELNQGNSGGPLINKKGQVVGMNNFKIANSEGLGFALESNYIKEGVNLISLEMLNQTLIE